MDLYAFSDITSILGIYHRFTIACEVLFLTVGFVLTSVLNGVIPRGV